MSNAVRWGLVTFTMCVSVFFIGKYASEFDGYFIGTVISVFGSIIGGASIDGNL